MFAGFGCFLFLFFLQELIARGNKAVKSEHLHDNDGCARQQFYRTLISILHAKAWRQSSFESVPKTCWCCKCFHPFSIRCQGFLSRLSWGEGGLDKSLTQADTQHNNTPPAWVSGPATYHVPQSSPLLLGDSRITHVNQRLKTFLSRHFGVTTSVIVQSRRQKERGKGAGPVWSCRCLPARFKGGVSLWVRASSAYYWLLQNAALSANCLLGFIRLTPHVGKYWKVKQI